MSRHKVTVVGAGNVGATTAQRIAEAGLADVVLVDIVEGLPQGKGLDLAEAAPVVGHDRRIVGTNDYADTAGSDIVVVTSGLARQPGMSRDDLLAKNAGIVRSVVEQAVRHSPAAILIIVTNPLDAMCHVAHPGVGLPARAGPRDGRRPRLGPLPDVHRRGARRVASRTPTRSSSAATATRWSRCRATRRSPACRSPSCSAPERVKALCDRTANGGAEVVALLKTGSAFYAPAASTFEMVESILLDRKRVLPCAVLLQGEFGVDGLFVGVPVVLGEGGLERVFEIELTADERAAFERSADAVRELVAAARLTPPGRSQLWCVHAPQGGPVPNVTVDQPQPRVVRSAPRSPAALPGRHWLYGSLPATLLDGAQPAVAARAHRGGGSSDEAAGRAARLAEPACSGRSRRRALAGPPARRSASRRPSTRSTTGQGKLDTKLRTALAHGSNATVAVFATVVGNPASAMATLDDAHVARDAQRQGRAGRRPDQGPAAAQAGRPEERGQRQPRPAHADRPAARQPRPGHRRARRRARGARRTALSRLRATDVPYPDAPPLKGSNFDALKKLDLLDAKTHDFAEAWNMGYDGTGATVSILDGGSDWGHPDLIGTWLTGPDRLAAGVRPVRHARSCSSTRARSTTG